MVLSILYLLARRLLELEAFRLLTTAGERTALPRHQTLRALVDWSYELLNERERAVLCRLSVFAGGWTLDGAEAVCAGDDVEEWELLDVLASLVDKSLVHVDPSEGVSRYRLLETVRQYGAEQLARRGEDEVLATRTKHCYFYSALAESAAPKAARTRAKDVDRQT